MVDEQNETYVGYVIDVACVRKSPAGEVFDRAAGHTTECALMGHCVESGFALVDEDGRLHLLEPAATSRWCANCWRQTRRGVPAPGLARA